MRSCAHCGRQLDHPQARYCSASCRAIASQARRREALALFLEGSRLRASGEWDPETVAALDREAERLLGVRQ